MEQEKKIDVSKYKKAPVDLSKYKKAPTPYITGTQGLGKSITDFGIGVGTTIGKAGLGLGEVAVKGLGELVGMGALDPLSTITRTPKIDRVKGKEYLYDIAKGVKDVSEAVYDQPQFKKGNETLAGALGQGVGNIAVYLAPSSAVSGAQGAITKGLSAIPQANPIVRTGVGAVNILGRAGVEGINAGAVTLAQTGGNDMKKVMDNALIGGAFSAGLQTAGAGINALKELIRSSNTAKNVLSATSGVPKEAIKSASKYGIEKTATPEKSIEAVREGVREYRGMLSKYWDAKTTELVDEFTGSRVGLTDDLLARYTKVADEFGIDPKLIPKDLRNMSVKETLDLMKGVNELDSVAVRLSPKGAIVRQLKPELKELAIKNFGGADGNLAKLWSDYSIKSEVFNKADDIVKAYKNNPTTAVTAKNKLMAIFDENKPEYLKAIQDLERELGKNFTKDVASTKFQNLFPTRIAKADGGLPVPKEVGIIDRAIQTVTLPLSSPRAVGGIVSPSNPVATPFTNRVFGSAVPQVSDDIISAGMKMKAGAPLNTIASHVNTTKQVLDNMSRQDIFNRGGLPQLIERTKINIVDQLANEGSKAISEAIKKIDTSTLNSLDELVSAIAKVVK